MVKVLILSEIEYQTFPVVDGMIDVTNEDLNNIGKTKMFDIKNQKVVDIETETEELEEVDEEIIDETEEVQSEIKTNVME